MIDQNRFAAGRRGPGRPEQSLEIQLEFIQCKEANKRWDKIFELLEVNGWPGGGDALHNQSLNQLRLF